MDYSSTRGEDKGRSFESILLTGLAKDGGLFMPDELPTFTQDQIRSWRGLPYHELAFHVMWPFVEGDIEQDRFREILEETYNQEHFRHSAIAPLKQLTSQHYVLELFHGPTLAFKDFALQLLGRLLDEVLSKNHQKVVILGATSGDTGSAAIAGCMRCKSADIVILHPHGRVSDVQRRQMTTLSQDNVHNVALEGSFDDCQHIVKSLFQDQSFLEGRQLVAVNSINWARIMAQIVYYFYAGLQLGSPDREMAFSVPTGNFGDIFAGYLAKAMGLPIHKLIVATNKNDVLHRILKTNEYSKHTVYPTIAPSMDIMVSSNFERMLYEVYGKDGEAIKALMEAFKQGTITFEDDAYQKLCALYDSQRCDDDQIQRVIQEQYAKTEEILDPHTATGIYAAMDGDYPADVPVITLATAHPAKFPQAIEDALGISPPLPNHLADLFEREERFDVLDNSDDAIKAYILDKQRG